MLKTLLPGASKLPMHLRYKIAAAASLITITAVFVLPRGEKLPVINLPGPTELRVLSTSFGTRHFPPVEGRWTELANRLLPPEWTGKLGLKRSQASTRNSSLVLFVIEHDPQKNKSVRPSFWAAHAVFPDGSMARAEQIFMRSNMVGLSFQNYPRREPVLDLLITASGEQFPFQVRNPRQAKILLWEAFPLPQTNHLAQSVIILRTNTVSDSSPLSLRLLATNGSAPAWLAWRTELFDPSGNWIELNGPRLFFKGNGSHLEFGPIKLIAHPTEYISAGMTELPRPGTVTNLKSAARSADLGVDSIFLLGPGAYLIEGSTPSLLTTRNVSERLEQNGNIVHVETVQPALLIKYREGAGDIKARLRERRPPGNDGKVFSAARFLSATNNSRPAEIVRLFPLTVRTGQTRLEAEVIVHHTAATFHLHSTNLFPLAE